MRAGGAAVVAVGPLVRRVQALYPQGARTPARMRELWNATVDAWHGADFGDVPPWASGGDQLRLDVERFVERMAGYRAVLIDATSEADLDPVVRGLLINYPGSGHPTPDFATPYSLENQYQAGREAFGPDAFVAALEESAQTLPDRAEDTAEAVTQWTTDTAEFSAEMLSRVIGGAARGAGFWIVPAAAAVGLLGYFAIRRVR